MNWTLMFLQNSNSPMMEFLMFFYDLTMIVIIMLIMVFLMMLMFIKFMKNFSNNFFENQSLEDLWLIIPIILLMFIGFPSIKNLYMCEEFSECDLNFKINGHQWYWTYEMNFLNLSFDSILNMENFNFRLLETFNHLILPSKCLIRLLITSEDVIHSWTIPSLGVKMDATPGRVSQIIMMINRPGILLGQCSEICGANHSFMPIVVSSNSMKNFINI